MPHWTRNGMALHLVCTFGRPACSKEERVSENDLLRRKSCRQYFCRILFNMSNMNIFFLFIWAHICHSLCILKCNVTYVLTDPKQSRVMLKSKESVTSGKKRGKRPAGISSYTQYRLSLYIHTYVYIRMFSSTFVPSCARVRA